jgi:biopolymer transport protein ExbD
MRPCETALKIDMTPMIDCVFQLLVFFVVTLRPPDILAHLDVARPGVAREPGAAPLVRIRIGRDGYAINEEAVDPLRLPALLRRLGALSTSQTVLLACCADAPHGRLVTALDACADAGLTNLAVVSMEADGALAVP